jgi:surfeit locus 1 family protein
MALFIGLGTWQVQRLDEKERLIASVASRFELAPVPLPPVGEWPAFDTAAWTYRPVTLTGSYLPAGTVLVFTSLTEPNGPRSGPGYWVMTPLQLADGGIVFVNRGFVPQESGHGLSRRRIRAGGGDADAVTGIARAPEASGSFTPAADATNRIEWVRDPARLAALAGDLPQPVAPIYIDAARWRCGSGAAAGRRDGGRVSQQSSGLCHHLVRLRAAGAAALWFWARRQRPDPRG